MKRELTDEEKEMLSKLFNKMDKMEQFSKYWSNIKKIIKNKDN